MKYFIYYDKRSEAILDFFPTDMSDVQKELIRELWHQDIPKKILKLLTQLERATAPLIKEKIGHSMSTLHENIKKLEDAKLVTTEMIYEGNKQKVISTNILCIQKNSNLTEKITRFLNQGLWVDTERSNRIIEYMQKHPDSWFTIEELSAKTNIQVDEVKTLLDNWNSQLTRSFSDFLKKTPFEQRTLYRAKK